MREFLKCSLVDLAPFFDFESCFRSFLFSLKLSLCFLTLLMSWIKFLANQTTNQLLCLVIFGFSSHSRNISKCHWKSRSLNVAFVILKFCLSKNQGATFLQWQRTGNTLKPPPSMHKTSESIPASHEVWESIPVLSWDNGKAFAPWPCSLPTPTPQMCLSVLSVFMRWMKMWQIHGFQMFPLLNKQNLFKWSKQLFFPHWISTHDWI